MTNKTIVFKKNAYGSYEPMHKEHVNILWHVSMGGVTVSDLEDLKTRIGPLLQDHGYKVEVEI